jgi:hypothetical protein
MRGGADHLVGQCCKVVFAALRADIRKGVNATVGGTGWVRGTGQNAAQQPGWGGAGRLVRAKGFVARIVLPYSRDAIALVRQGKGG